MFYAFQIKKTDNALTTMNGILLNECLAFETKRQRYAALEQIYTETDNNLIFCTRKEVEREFGRDFIVIEGRVLSNSDAELYYMNQQ